MRASTKRILSILTSALLMIAVVVIYIKLIKPDYTDVQKLRGEIQARKNLLEEQTNAVRQVQELISQLQNQNITHFQEEISLILPLTESIPQAVDQYQAVARAAGLSIQSIGLNYLAIKPAASDTGLAKGIGTIRFKLKLLGSYEGMKVFSQAIETNVRLTDLVDFKINRTAQPGQNLYLNEITVDSYYQSK